MGRALELRFLRMEISWLRPSRSVNLRHGLIREQNGPIQLISLISRYWILAPVKMQGVGLYRLERKLSM